jgi:hypothetical protein
VQGELNLWPENVEATRQREHGVSHKKKGEHGEVDGADGEWQRLEYGGEGGVVNVRAEG